MIWTSSASPEYRFTPRKERGGGIFPSAGVCAGQIHCCHRRKEQILMALQGLSVAENRQSDELLAKWVDFSGSARRLDRSRLFRLAQNTAKADVFDQIKGAILSRHKIKFSYFSGGATAQLPHSGAVQAGFQKQRLVLVRLLLFCGTTFVFQIDTNQRFGNFVRNFSAQSSGHSRIKGKHPKRTTYPGKAEILSRGGLPCL